MPQTVLERPAPAPARPAPGRLAPALRVLRGAALFLPLLALVAFVNVTVDPASLFQRDYEYSAAQIVASGHNAANLKNMDDRAFQKDCAELLPAAPGTLVLGSSRCLQVTARIAGDAALFNAGVTNGDLRDSISLYELYKGLGKAPRRVILMSDYCAFNPQKLDARAYTDGYADFARRTGTQEMKTRRSREKWRQLFAPTYFQSALAYLEAGGGAGDRPVASDEYEAGTDMRRADGSYSYNAGFRSQTAAERVAGGWVTAGNIEYNMGAYEADSEVLRSQFELFVAEMLADGVEVVLLLPPINPYMYDLMAADPDYAGELALEGYFKGFAARNGLATVGSYDARALGLTEDDFYDALHCSLEATARYWAAAAEAGGEGAP